MILFYEGNNLLRRTEFGAKEEDRPGLSRFKEEITDFNPENYTFVPEEYIRYLDSKKYEKYPVKGYYYEEKKFFDKSCRDLSLKGIVEHQLYSSDKDGNINEVKVFHQAVSRETLKIMKEIESPRSVSPVLTELFRTFSDWKKEMDLICSLNSKVSVADFKKIIRSRYYDFYNFLRLIHEKEVYIKKGEIFDLSKCETQVNGVEKIYIANDQDRFTGSQIETAENSSNILTRSKLLHF